MLQLLIPKYKNIVIFIFIGLLGFVLRIVHANTINNAIHDLGARHVLACFDNIHGNYHFPHLPWILEYDEAVYSWLMVPWVLIFGRSWASFRLFGTVIASMVPPFIYWLTAKRFNQFTGVVAGLFFASVPMQLVWDRYLVMNFIMFVTLLWMFSLYLSSINSTKTIHYVLIAFVLSVSTWFAHYPLIAPVVILAVLIKENPIKTKIYQCITIVFAYFIFTLPLILYLFRNPYYLLWRKRHFQEEIWYLQDVLGTFFNAMIYFFRSLVWGNYDCILSNSEAAVLNSAMAIFVVAGAYFLIKADKQLFLFALGLPIIKYLLLGFIKTENWSSMYHAFSMPYFAITASVGLCGLLDLITKRMKRKFAAWLSVAVVGFLIILNIWQFFKGPYQIHPRPDTMTRLQSDMKSLEKIPYLFSTGISEVTHYHMPFWVATRTWYHDRISIIGFENGQWVSDPDKQPLELSENPNKRVGIVVEEKDLELYRENLGYHVILDEYRLPESKFYVMICAIDVPDLLQRTWTDSYVPPVLPIKRD